MRILGFITTLALLAVPISVSADAVSTHMAPVQWFVGSWHCANMSVIGGKTQKPTATVEQVTRRGPWLDFVSSDDKNGLVSFTYDPHSSKYVFVGTASDSSYFVGNATVSKSGISYNFPSLTADPPDDPNASVKITSSQATQYVFTNTGTSASGKNKGKAYSYKSVCTKA